MTSLLTQITALIGPATVLAMALLGVLYTLVTLAAALMPRSWPVTLVCARLALDLRRLLKLPEDAPVKPKE